MHGEETASRVVGGRYSLSEQLGRGGMGTVWRAVDGLLQREVAVKHVAVPPSLDGPERAAARDRVMREAQAAARLSHQASVTVFDVLEDDGSVYIVMELVDCANLAELIERRGPLTPHQAAQLGLELVGALEAAHRQGIVHRDVKPSNVMMLPTGAVKLTDFGIASVKDHPSLTSTGQVLGSPAYMAPEQALGRRSGPEADWWGLGATLYFALEGRPPFERPGALPTLTAVVSEDPAATTNAGAMAPVLAGLLAKEPAQRLGASELRRLLRPLAASTGPQADGAAAAATTAVLERAPAPAPPGVPAGTEPAPPGVSAGTEPAPPGVPAGTEPAPPGVPAGTEPAPPGVPAGTEPAPPGVPAGTEPAPPGVPAGTEPAPPGVPAGTEPAPPPPAAEPVRPVSAPPPPAAAPARQATPPPPLPAETVRQPQGPLIGAFVLVAALLAGTVAWSGSRDDAGSPDAAPTTASSPGTTVTTAEGGDQEGVPTDWVTYTDPKVGYRIAHPADWQVRPLDGTRTDITDPATGRYLRVDWTATPGPSPEGAWESLSKSFGSRHEAYQEIAIEPTTYKGFDAAAWEYAYTAKGARLHAVNLGMVTSTHGFALNFQTPEERWSSSQPLFDAFKASFQVPA